MSPFRCPNDNKTLAEVEDGAAFFCMLCGYVYKPERAKSDAGRFDLETDSATLDMVRRRLGFNGFVPAVELLARLDEVMDGTASEVRGPR